MQPALPQTLKTAISSARASSRLQLTYTLVGRGNIVLLRRRSSASFFIHNTSTISTTPTSSSFSNMAATTDTTAKKDITIIGGGIIGCTTAYYLTRHPLYNPSRHRITLLEASASSSAGGRTGDSIKDPAELAYPSSSSTPHSMSDNTAQVHAQQRLNPYHDGIASGASGKAGGLLALWAYPSNIVPLSFRLHEELAREHSGETRWGYRRCWASQVECRARMPGSFGSGSGSGRGHGNGGGSQAVAGGDTSRTAPDNADGNTKGLHKQHKAPASALKRLGVPDDLDWLAVAPASSGSKDSKGQEGTGGGLQAYENMGTPENTAQVHPELFTRSMAALAEEQGVRIITGARVTSINTATSTGTTTATTEGAKADKLGNTATTGEEGGEGEVQSVTYTLRQRHLHSSSSAGKAERESKEEEEIITLPTTHVIVAAGPWAPTLLPSGPIVTASRAHSVVIQPSQPVSAYALFTAITLPAGFPAPTTTTTTTSPKLLKRPTTVEPEIYARPDGTAYACGPTDDDVPLPALASDVAVDEARCADIVRQVGSISNELDTTTSSSGAKVLAKQACYLPQGGPWIGPVPGFAGRGSRVVVAAGHTCWGIQNAPATGKLVSEIVLEGQARSARLGECEPSRGMM